MTTEILAVPKWLTIIRGIQLLLAVTILGISAYGVYWVAFNAFGFAIFVSLATIIIALYNILTTRVASLTKLYNHWAVLALDIFGIIFWLSAMGALAALRAIFVIPTTINGCGHTGDIGGGYCYKAKRALEALQKRQSYVATHGYLNLMSVAAGFSGILFVLFILTLVYTSIAIHKTRKARSGSVEHEESKVESHGMEAVPPPPASYGQPEQHYEQPPPATYQQPPPPASYPH